MKKLIKISIIVIIPLLAGFLTSLYAYNRYQPMFFNYYMDEASDTNSEDRLVSFLEFSNEYLEYEKKDDGYDFFFSEEITNEHGTLFHLDIIRGYYVNNEEYTKKTGKKSVMDVNYVIYYVFLHNINYETLAKTLDPTLEHKLRASEIPAISIKFTDTKDEDINFEEGLSTVSGVENVIIYDYGYSPTKDAYKQKLTNSSHMLARYSKFDASRFSQFSNEVKLAIVLSSTWSGSDKVTDEACEITLTDLYNHVDYNETTKAKTELESFTGVLNGDIFEAGYFKYAFSKYIWWEALIAIAIFLIVCISFVAIWSSDSTSEGEQKNPKVNKQPVTKKKK